MNIFLFFKNLTLFELLMLSILPILSMLICIYHAGKVNKNRIIWGFLGLFLNVLAVLFIYAIEKKKVSSE